ncbi:DUF4270 domain-containing protein [Flavivirga aquimarina]|uniref:DUF4270 domain-containing protein n=1 Tax=Flavivirga aquimarina TaxID=2027862 RepID=A0ABT8WEY3_9FLAO|nr:DUF4270 domain-containing protein [Flavivirga aquimarina]MDO5971562.1 DUF4270 domain-containing protein [Flavivirga aquimarina]
MKNTLKALKFSTAFLLILSSFIACDKDFSIIESQVLGKGNTNFTIDSLNIPITAYNKKLNSLKINNLISANDLNSALLGVFDDPEFGRTTASIIAQITPSSFDPNFGVNPVIDSVILTIPYFSRPTGLDGDDVTYTIEDSLYGDPSNEVTLTIYRNNYFLRSLNPNSTSSAQNYFSYANGDINTTDNFALIENNVINFDNHKSDILKDTTFTPIPDVVKTTVGEGDEAVTTDSEPAFRAHLYKDFWASTIIDQEGTSVLSNPSNFNDYFRGLYFKAGTVDDKGNMVLLNLASSNANIVMYYTSGEDDTRIQSTYSFSFSGNILNTFINDYITLENGDSDLGDETIYLKGTEGSMGVVDLFSNDDDALEDFKRDFRATDESGEYITDDTTGEFVLKKLINEAQLIIYEDESLTYSGDEDYHKYDRIYAYDIKNNTPIIDYFIDLTENESEPYNSFFIHLGQRDSDQKKYKIRLTEHLNNILLRDSMNTKIGLTLSTNVNITTQAEILESEDDVTAIPETAILTPRGTILHGSNENVVPSKKRMELQVFFTKPENN